jgi:nuclear pore complex protein Nup62
MAGNSPFTFPSTGSGGSLFGAKSDAPGSQPAAANSGAPTSLFGSAGTGGGLFGGGAKPASSTGLTFGNPAQKKEGESQEKPAGTGLFGQVAGSATPAPARPLFGSMSTTPAGTPAASGATQPSLFGKPTGTSTAPGGPGIFGLNKPATTSAAPTASSTSAAPTFSFPSASQTQSTSQTLPPINSVDASNTPKPLFGGGASTTPSAGAARPLFGAIQSATPSVIATSSLFPSKPAGESAPSTTTSQITAPTLALGGSGSTGGFSLFSPAAKPTPTTTAATTASASTPTAGFTLGAPKTNTAASLPQLASTPATTAPGASATSSGGFSLFSKPGATMSSNAPSTTTATTAAASTGPGTSTAPTTAASASQQPASSRLKNKSMDEILTRWATDLTKYQKEFQKQAEQVAEWDRILVDNTDKISKLVTKTIQAERDAAEVEKQLSLVENQQDELAQWLDKYDKEIDDMIQKVGLTGDIAGVDVDRERT